MYDVASINLTLRPHKNNHLPPWLGRASHAFFLRSLETIEPSLSKFIYDSDGPKPFTASNLQAPSRDVRPRDRLHLRYTTMHPHLTTLVQNAILPAWISGGVHLHDQAFQVEGVSLHPVDDPWAGFMRYDVLLETASEQTNRVTFQFATPTTFKRTRSGFEPFPSPDRVFGSLFNRWNSFAPAIMPDDMLDIISEQVAVREVNGRTEAVHYHRNHEPIPGFVGSVTYDFAEANALARKYLNTLSAYALYSGVGAKTTVGFGQARVT